MQILCACNSTVILYISYNATTIATCMQQHNNSAIKQCTALYSRLYYCVHATVLYSAVLNILYKYEVEKQIAIHLERLYEKAVEHIRILPHSIEYTPYLYNILDYVIGRKN